MKLEDLLPCSKESTTGACVPSHINSVHPLKLYIFKINFYIKIMVVFWGFTLCSVLWQFRRFRANRCRNKAQQTVKETQNTTKNRLEKSGNFIISI
jgi:hypothetical protein